jgi:hypothetical protein
MALACDDRTVRLWEVPSGKEVGSLEVVQVKRTDAQGREVHSVVSCGSPMPPGAVCTCNCVPGRLSVPKPSSGGSYCTCNKVCTCMAVPVCQAHKLLDEDPVVRTLARQLVLSMGSRELDYLAWAAATAPDKQQRVAVRRVIEEVAGGKRPAPSGWPPVETCIERLDSSDDVVRILAVQGLSHVTRNGTAFERLPSAVRERCADILRRAEIRSASVRHEIAAWRARQEPELSPARARRRR